MKIRRFGACACLVSCLLAAVALPSDGLRAQGAKAGSGKKAEAGAAGGGWTQFDGKPGAKTIHVANDGDDGNPGSEARPKATVEAGYEALRDGKADSLLLRRGDRWVMPKGLVWSKSGPLEPDGGWMRMGAYGDEAKPRPILDSVAGTGLTLTPGYGSDRVLANLAFTDVHVLASGRLADTRNAKPATAVFFVAVEWKGKGAAFRRMLFENVKIQGYQNGIVTGKDIEDLRLRRSIVTDMFNPGEGGSGVMSEANGLLLEDNVFFRIQHTDTPGVTAITFFAHSAYIGAAARDVVCRGNFIVKATEGFMVRSGGVYERNVSAENEIACMFGQAYGVLPKADGVEVAVRENLFLDNRGDFGLGNAKAGTFSQNLLLRTPDVKADQNVALIGKNEQRGGFNIGVHGVAFVDNVLTGKIHYANPEKDAEHYSGLSFTRNKTGVPPVTKSVKDFLRAAGLEGESMSDYAAALVLRDRANFHANLRTTAIVNFYRKAAGLPELAP